MFPDEIAAGTNERQQWFATTQWSVVLASRDSGSTSSLAALEKLCGTYWYPLYAFVRRQGYSPEDAQDLTQSFFERLLAKDYLASVDRQKGKFRSFLLASMNHLLSDERDRGRRQKRGGGAALISFDDQTAEERYQLEPVDNFDAKKIYERRWALTVLDRVLARLEAEFASPGKVALFARAKEFLQGDAAHGAYSAAAAELGMSEGALRVAVHRMRRRYGELFYEEIAHTVSGTEEIEEEINHLLACLA